ncbi:hypothetical protein Q5H93_21130 [Hymenobacter sp. ASUV-10]|uniref:GNAT family N-acetyltransferase n=1 Tax=Hymenobacter aranciens TaxID=3063996 RepID=A0ABT9BG76_9BACT|nr:hypothetical protein [Hymenobacter sp. ASUV-10]MDO7877262.1 hypothetical protein [Hymenobacter sp. ASUV-10]
MTNAQLMRCEHEYDVVFDNDDLEEISSYLVENFAGFDFLELVVFIADFAKSNDLYFDSIAAGVKQQEFRMEWVAGEGSVYDFLLERTLLIRNQIKVAVHDMFTLPERLQGQGKAKIILQGFYKQYLASGVQYIEVLAGKTIGGYAWALYGFEAIDPIKVAEIIELGRAHRDITYEQSALHFKIFTDFYAVNSATTPFPMRELATSPGGKALLKGRNWNGVLDLQNLLKRELFETYLGLAS